jgi:hypothetical protein
MVLRVSGRDCRYVLDVLQLYGSLLSRVGLFFRANSGSSPVTRSEYGFATSSSLLTPLVVKEQLEEAGR